MWRLVCACERKEGGVGVGREVGGASCASCERRWRRSRTEEFYKAPTHGYSTKVKVIVPGIVKDPSSEPLPLPLDHSAGPVRHFTLQYFLKFMQFIFSLLVLVERILLNLPHICSSAAHPTNSIFAETLKKR